MTTEGANLQQCAVFQGEVITIGCVETSRKWQKTVLLTVIPVFQLKQMDSIAADPTTNREKDHGT